MNKQAAIDRIKQTVEACQAQRTMYNRLFLTMESYDGRPVTKKIVEELEAVIPDYKVDFVSSKGYEKAVTFYPKNGKAAFQSFRFRLVYIPHHDNANFAAFQEMYGDQRHHNHMKLMQLQEFLQIAEQELEVIEIVLQGVRDSVTEAKGVLRSYKFMSELLDQDDRELIKAMGSI